MKVSRERLLTPSGVEPKEPIHGRIMLLSRQEDLFREMLAVSKRLRLSIGKDRTDQRMKPCDGWRFADMMEG
jgi:hypothetical protein